MRLVTSAVVKPMLASTNNIIPLPRYSRNTIGHKNEGWTWVSD